MTYSISGCVRSLSIIAILVIFLLLFYFGCNLQVQDDAPNIVFILIDTLRADHVGTYGYGRLTTPNIDSLAQKGIVFENVYSVSPWTNPTVASILSGYHPRRIFKPTNHGKAIRQAFPLEVKTVSESLKAVGYTTLALVDHPGINSKLNYDQGFDLFIESSTKNGWHNWIGSPQSEILKDLDEHLSNGSGKTFTFIHLIYPHRPYKSPKPYNALFGEGVKWGEEKNKDEMINAYDG